MALVNVWHLRRVADASSKPCDICYKATTSVLITPDNRDYFYVCPGHLKDRGFCTPVVDEAEAAAKRKKEMDREIELIQKEYEDKMKRKKSKEKQGKDKGKEDGQDDKKKDDVDDEKAEKEKNDKIKAITNTEPSSVAHDTPRIYALQKYDTYHLRAKSGFFIRKGLIGFEMQRLPGEIESA